MTNNKFSLNSISKSIAVFITKNPNRLGLGKEISSIKLKPLGKGESNISILAIVNRKYWLTFGIAQLYEDKLEKEYEILSKIPSGIGPKPVYLNTEKKIIHLPFLVESFVSGVNITEWNSGHLSSLAETLAELHTKTKIKRLKNISFKNLLEKDNNYFLKNYPELTKDKKITNIIKSVSNYLDSKEYLIDKVKQLSIVHGDLNTNNIIVSDKKISLIDWELAHYNDPAREFSTFYYDDMKYLNWRVQLKPTLKDYFLNKYISKSGLQDDYFKKRVGIWQIVDKTEAFIYCSWKSLLSKNYKEKTIFTNTADLLKSSLDRTIAA